MHLLLACVVEQLNEELTFQVSGMDCPKAEEFVMVLQRHQMEEESCWVVWEQSVHTLCLEMDESVTWPCIAILM